jgi:hypothetical protein
VFDSRDGLSLYVGQRIYVRSRSRNLIGASPDSLTFSRLIVSVPTAVSVPPCARLVTSWPTLLVSNSVYLVCAESKRHRCRPAPECIHGFCVCVRVCMCVPLSHTAAMARICSLTH